MLSVVWSVVCGTNNIDNVIDSGGDNKKCFHWSVKQLTV